MYDKDINIFWVVKLLYDKIVIQSIDICYVNKIDLQRKIGQRIVELRTKLSWSQSDLARACNKDRQAIEKLENGKVNPTLYTLLEVSKALGVKVRDLINF